VAHAEPGRVPAGLWGSTCGVTDPLYLRLLAHRGMGEPVVSFRRRRAHTVNDHDGARSPHTAVRGFARRGAVWYDGARLATEWLVRLARSQL